MDRTRYAMAAVLALGIAILCGVLAGLLGRGHFAGRYAVPAQHSEPSIVVAPAPAVLAAPPPRGSPPPVIAIAPPPSEDAPVAEDDDDRARIAAAIARATRKALDRGQPVRWRKAGQSGYVVVSDAQQSADRVCRNVSATIVDEAGETRSGAHLWCLAADDDDWQPVR